MSCVLCYLKISKKCEKFSRKIWRKRKKAYLCNPKRKTGYTKPQVWSNKFIEKTENCTRSKYRENTIYREALILLKELRVSVTS